MSLDIDAIKTQLHNLIKKHGSQRAAARALGISQTQLFDLLNDRRRPGPRTLAALGLTSHVVYERDRSDNANGNSR